MVRCSEVCGVRDPWFATQSGADKFAGKPHKTGPPENNNVGLLYLTLTQRLCQKFPSPIRMNFYTGLSGAHQ